MQTYKGAKHANMQRQKTCEYAKGQKMQTYKVAKHTNMQRRKIMQT